MCWADLLFNEVCQTHATRFSSGKRNYHETWFLKKTKFSQKEKIYFSCYHLATLPRALSHLATLRFTFTDKIRVLGLTGGHDLRCTATARWRDWRSWEPTIHQVHSSNTEPAIFMSLFPVTLPSFYHLLSEIDTIVILSSLASICHRVVLSGHQFTRSIGFTSVAKTKILMLTSELTTWSFMKVVVVVLYVSTC